MRSSLFAVTVILLLATACAEPEVSEVDALRALPVAQLTYPGSVEVRDGGSNSRDSITGLQPAFTFRLMGTKATPQEIFDWYAAELEADGWVPGGGGAQAASTSELQATGWVRDGLIFRLGVLNPEVILPELQGDWAYIYDARVMVDDREAE